jgi:hypothetical protein
VTQPSKLSKWQNAWWLVAAALAGWGWWAYQGPYRWVAELQIRLFDAYYLQITFLLSMLVVGLPGVWMIGWLERRRGGVEAPAAAAWDVSPYWILLLPLGSVAVGAYQYTQVSRMRLHSTTASELQWGRVPSARWISIEGRPLVEAAICTTERRYSRDCYVPLVSPEWTPVVPIAAFIHLRGAPDHLSDGPFQGTTSYRRLPGAVRVAYEESALGAPHRSYVVLDLGAGPKDVYEHALAFLLMGAVSTPLLAIAFWLHDRREKQVARVVARSRADAHAAALRTQATPAAEPAQGV